MTDTDIFERLRRPDDGDPFNAGWNACLDEAAAEIEQLRAKLERADQFIKFGYIRMPDALAVGGEPGASAGKSE